MRHVHKVSFPGAVYRNRIKWKDLLEWIQQVLSYFYNIFTSGIEMFVIPWDQLLYPVS